ncbi:translation initiation factor eIF2B subunit alpha isoform X2 [Nerophis lumbriciformis]|uniref:translation initiation factor eIF2B subunit alpha isoform X2 n=1 Tax=Nerophis lumbriciformis TaxID=546530 RepID=UPI002AE07182|nr:translation initiation factor eIF-2B subunit alpha-like isoform X2 [Nerophis lumbriciformis]
MNEEELVENFRAQMRNDPDVASAVAAIRTLLEFLKRDQGETLLGLGESLKWATDRLTAVDSSVALSSGGELFLRFISLTSLEHQDLSRCKKVMEERGELFLEKISMSRSKVAKLCHTFIKDGAAADGRRLEEAQRSCDRGLGRGCGVRRRNGHKYGDTLYDINWLACVRYILEKVDQVIVGAEGVVESGGIINKIGTYQTAVCAKAHNKPFYVVAESFKFVRLYPLNQQDVPDKFKYKVDTLKHLPNLSEEHPLVDYTPPSLITLLFTDLGVLTPSAVSDELIKLYL